jgi:protein-S-isoprenylcysteine O-methyltransferase Ste14
MHTFVLVKSFGRVDTIAEEGLVSRSGLHRDIYELQDPSIGQRITLTILVGIGLALAWWLLVGRGLEATSAWLGGTWKPGDPIRRACLVTALSIYYTRLLFTWFVFLKRGMSWSEVFTVAPWVLGIYLLLAICGGTDSTMLGAAGGVGAALFVAGSWMNSYAEYARMGWKQKPENRRQLYTDGLFRYSRHPNYFGDLLSFSGLCLISGCMLSAIIPLVMLAGFLFVNIPMLDSHLQNRYGKAFDEYARRTRKLIPFIY